MAKVILRNGPFIIYLHLRKMAKLRLNSILRTYFMSLRWVPGSSLLKTVTWRHLLKAIGRLSRTCSLQSFLHNRSESNRPQISAVTLDRIRLQWKKFRALNTTWVDAYTKSAVAAQQLTHRSLNLSLVIQIKECCNLLNVRRMRKVENDESFTLVRWPTRVFLQSHRRESTLWNQ